MKQILLRLARLSFLGGLLESHTWHSARTITKHPALNGSRFSEDVRKQESYLQPLKCLSWMTVILRIYLHSLTQKRRQGCHPLEVPLTRGQYFLFLSGSGQHWQNTGTFVTLIKKKLSFLTTCSFAEKKKGLLYLFLRIVWVAQLCSSVGGA